MYLAANNYYLFAFVCVWARILRFANLAKTCGRPIRPEGGSWAIRTAFPVPSSRDLLVSVVQVPRIWGGAPCLGYWGVPRYSAGREISPYTEEQNRSQGAGGGFGCQSPCPGFCNIVDVRPCVHVCVHVVVRICHLHLYVPYTQCFELGFVCICTLEEFEYWSFRNFGGMFIGSASRSHVGSW